MISASANQRAPTGYPRCQHSRQGTLPPRISSVTSSASHYAASDDLPAEVERLRTALDKLPTCLMRVATDGTLLAVSDVALSLLGARELAEVLGTNFVARLSSGDAGATAWAEFVERVLQGGSGSAECDMIDLGGVQRAVVLLGVALPDHPDTGRSLLVTVRDVSTARRLEASLHEQEELRRTVQEGLESTTATVQQLRAELQEAADERHHLRAALDEEIIRRQQMASMLEQLTRALSVAVNTTTLAREALEKGTST